jgi:hypothetical protein
MQSATYQHHNQRLAGPLKTQNQFMAHRRDNFKHRSIQAAVREWESTLPGQAQEKIAQLVAEQWVKEGGRGIAVNKQNLFRYLKTKLARKIHRLRHATVGRNRRSYAY